jgi:hypothetical protein
MHSEDEDRLPSGQGELARARGTGRRLARIRDVRLTTFLALGAALGAPTACSGGSPAAPTFSPTSSVVSDDAGSSAPEDASGPSAAASDGSSVAAVLAHCGASPATGSFPSDVAAVLTDKCQTCHNDPTKNGAPFPLLTYDDVHKPFVGTMPIYAEMYVVIQPGADPHMPFGNAPQLTADQFSTLSRWLIACAPPGD